MTEAVTGSSNDYYLPDKNQNVKEQQTLADPDAFLKILVAQMKYQNPMEPQDSSTFISQLTQMASMEQIYNMSESMSNMASEYELTRYFQLIGQQVSVVNEDTITTGLVGGVSFYDNEPCFYFEGASGGSKYTLDDVISITGKADDGLLLPYLSLVGRQVTVKDDDSETGGVVEKVLLKNGGVFVRVNGTDYSAAQIIGISSAPEETANQDDSGTEEETAPAADTEATEE
ncbi:flagellar basal-body rod modification protein FlgD [Desulfotomaculum arcticum]|uniref:Basal-body rod modification protein FlgD n=1 Tax=Desulfotruncus arcticus DSM 17038 TaxID=1121424 RepID=A0A1I2MWK1_9FIRM|nr:flagellar hook capping FlgD N-terminal domain-containing protein [Desulfotruncus arcticus]SFF95944.1 flagellar basal-body rod modification protein FlgD [Desulfotomaculum arcticum] [Desulfotruncus arcticus DSM 17038]